MLVLKNNVDKDAVFTDLEEAKDWYMPNLEELPEQKEYAEEIEEADTFEELAKILNKYTDTFGDGRLHEIVL